MTELGINFFKTASLMFGVALVPLLIYAVSSVGTAFDAKTFCVTSRTRIAVTAICTTLIALLVTVEPATASGLVSIGASIYLIAFAIGAVCTAAIRGNKQA